MIIKADYELGFFDYGNDYSDFIRNEYHVLLSGLPTLSLLAEPNNPQRE